MVPREEINFVISRLEGWVKCGLGKLNGSTAVSESSPEPLRGPAEKQGQGPQQRGGESGEDKREGEGIAELHLELTHRCDQKCIMCHHWEMPVRDPSCVKREMSLEDIRKFVTESGLLKDVKIVIISGGEPWIREDTPEITAFLREYYPNASIGILTNLWNTEIVRRNLMDIKNRGVNDIWLGSSLDGMGGTHDRMRGRRGAFQGLIRTIEMMRKEFPEIEVSLNFIITPVNYRDIWPAYKFASEMGLSLGAQMVVDHKGLHAPETFTWKEEELEETGDQIEKIVADICEKEGARDWLVKNKEREALWLWTRLLYWWYLKKYSRKPERFFKGCMAGKRYALFDPEGNLFFCPVNKHRIIGNVREKPFDEIWTSERAQLERKYVNSGLCHCWVMCTANPILDILVEKGINGNA